MPTAPKFGFPQGAPLFDVSLRAVSEGLAGNGVLSLGDFVLTEGAADLEIDVAGGSLWYEGAPYTDDGATLTASPGDPDNQRWDLVVYDTNAEALALREGTPSVTPEPPALGSEEVLLGYVAVPAGATDVPAGNLYEWRALARQAGATFLTDAAEAYDTPHVEGALAQLTPAAGIEAYPLTSAALAAAAVTTAEIADGTITDADISGSTTLAREKLDTNRATREVSGTVTTAADETLFVDTSGGPATVTLATADAVAGRAIRVVDATGSASANAITVETEGGESLHSPTGATVSTDHGYRAFESDGAAWFEVSAN